MRLVTRVVDSRDDLSHAVLFPPDLGDHEIVLVVASDGEEQLGGASDPGELEHVDLGCVAADDDGSELLLEPREALRTLLDQRDLMAHLEQRTCDVRADLASARNDDVHQLGPAGSSCPVRTASSISEIAVCVGQTVCRPRSA